MNQKKNNIKIIVFIYVFAIITVFILGYIHHLSKNPNNIEQNNSQNQTSNIANINDDSLIKEDEIQEKMKEKEKEKEKEKDDNYYDNDKGLTLVDGIEQNLIKKSLDIIGQGKFLEVNNFLASELKKYDFNLDDDIMSYYQDFSKLPFLEEASLEYETNMIKGMSNMEVVIITMPRVDRYVQNNIIVDKDSFSIYLSENQNIKILDEKTEINEDDIAILTKYFTESDTLEKFLVTVNNIKLKVLIAEDYNGKYLLGFYPIDEKNINIFPSINEKMGNI